MRVAERVAQRIGKLHALEAGGLAVQPLDEQVGRFLVLRGGGNRQAEARRQFRVSARRHGIANLAGDGGLRHPAHHFLVGAVAGGPAAIGRPRDRHCRLALQEGGEVLDEAPLLNACRRPLVLGHPVGEHLHAGVGVDRRLHGVGVEELAAFVAEALLEHEVAVARLTEEGRAIELAATCLGDDLADLVEVLPVGGRHGHVGAVLVLVGLLDGRVVQHVGAIVHDEHVAVVRQAIDLAVHLHLVVAIGGRDLHQLVAVAVLVDEGVEVFQRAGIGEVGHPGRDHVERVIGAGTRLEVLHDLGEHLGHRNLDDLDVDAGEFLPLGTREVERVQRLQPGFPNDGDRLAGVLLGRFDRRRGAICGIGRARSQSGCPGNPGRNADLAHVTSCNHVFLPLLNGGKTQPFASPFAGEFRVSRSACRSPPAWP